MRQRPIPTVICSTLVEDGGDTALAALEAGAVELILKPAIGTKEFFEESSIRICDVIKAAAKATIAHRGLWSEPKIAIKPSAEKVVLRALAKTTDKVVAIGASTGGTEALRALLCEMPRNCPPIVIVQHMPAGFTTSFAKRLNDLSAIEVKEAEDGDQVVPGRAILARGDRHLRLNRSGARYFVNVYEAPLVSRHRPSVNVLFHSVAEIAGANAIGVILTGMGDDGADGLLAMRKAGAQTVGQDEESCVVYGMPREAFLRGAVVKQVALPQVANAVLAMAEG
jgi:two-component system chemotaxis response regulator CheB